MATAKKPAAKKVAKKPAAKKVAKKTGAKSDWFSKLSPAAQKAYIKAHPNSKYAKGGKKVAAAKTTAKTATKKSSTLDAQTQKRISNYEKNMKAVIAATPEQARKVEELAKKYHAAKTPTAKRRAGQAHQAANAELARMKKAPRLFKERISMAKRGAKIVAAKKAAKK